MGREGREWEGQNSGEQTFGDLWKGEGWGGEHTPETDFFFVYFVEARVRANTQCTARGHETRGAGVGGTKQWGTETLGDLWKGEGWDGEHGE